MIWICVKKTHRSTSKEGSLIVIGKEKPRKTINQTIKSDLDFNDLSLDLIHDRTLWGRLIHIAIPN